MKLEALLASWKLAIGISAGISSFAWAPATLEYHRDWANEPVMEAVKNLGELVLSLKVLDKRNLELNKDRDDIEDSIKALELELRARDIAEPHRRTLERVIESERNKLYEILRRLDQATEYDQQIIQKLEKTYA